MPQGLSHTLDQFDTKTGSALIDVKSTGSEQTHLHQVPVAQESAIIIDRLKALLGDDASAARPYLTQNTEGGPARITELLVAGDSDKAVSARVKLNAVLSSGLTEPGDKLTAPGDTFSREQVETIASRLKASARAIAG